MRNLFIIGNGFDLAHGIKSSYYDFLGWLIKKEILNIWPGLTALSGVTNKKFGGSNDFLRIEVYRGNLIEIKNLLESSSNLEQLLLPQLKVYYKTPLLNKILSERKSNANWSDIESQYFKILVNLAKENVPEKNISNLNNELEWITLKLEKYLIEASKNIPELNPYKKIFRPRPKSRTISENGTDDKILNFNYTKTYNKYCNQGNIKSTINIHGILRKEQDRETLDGPIFGYGDETTDDYSFLENLDKNILLENIKSVKYLTNDSYSQFTFWINNYLLDEQGRDFRVHILGHSCGLSDRVLLKEIFEHNKCKEILVYHYNGKKSFEDNVINISRHFSDNVEMRQKVKDYDPKLRMPQWNDKENK
jgi:hypothetical protein